MPYSVPALVPGAFWGSPACQGDPTCANVTRLALQQSLLRPARWSGLGSLLQHFLEPFVGLSFHPELMFGENRGGETN